KHFQAARLAQLAQFLRRIKLPLEHIRRRWRRIDQRHALAFSLKLLVLDDLPTILFKPPHWRGALEKFPMSDIQDQSPRGEKKLGNRSQHRRLGRFIEISKALPHADGRVEPFLYRAQLAHVALRESNALASDLPGACQKRFIAINGRHVISTLLQPN